MIWNHPVCCFRRYLLCSSGRSPRHSKLRSIPGPRFGSGIAALCLAAAGSSMLCPSAFAQGTPAPHVDGADTAWVLISTALVLLMTPGLALFYGGMVRSKNVLGTIAQSLVAMAVVGLQWIFWGYSLAFGPDIGHVIGSLSWAGLNHVGLLPNADYAPTVPAMAFMMFQCMFAVITPALITGGFAERMKFSTYLVFLLLWSTLVYDPVAHWVWGNGGWLHQAGTIDFAGGIVVHITSGYAALVAALMMRERKGYPGQEMRPHNLVWTVVGTGLLWFGWFGFNAGSALGINGIAVLAFTTTNTAAASATVVWMLLEWGLRGKPTALGMVSGAVAGLAGVTPACGYIGVIPAALVGAVAGALCFFAVSAKPRLGYDDSLDTFGVHGISGTWGAIAIGLFAQFALNGVTEPGGQQANGLFFGGGFHQLVSQFQGIIASGIYTIVVTYLLLKALDSLMGLRVDSEAEDIGLDISQHGEEAYLHG